MNKPLIKKGWLRALVFLIIWFLLQAGALKIVYDLLKPMITPASGQTDPSLDLLLMAFLGLAFNIPAVLVFRRLVDRKSVKSLGFEWDHYRQHALTGLLVSVFILCSGTLVLQATGNLHFIDLAFFPKDLILYILIMLLIAISEETVVRGYILNNLLESFPKWISLLISAGLFAALHLFNPGFSWLSLIGIFAGGILLGLNYIYTKNLWFGIFLHFGWNFVQGPLLGYEVSGYETDSLLVQSINGPGWLTGGAFGFESSLLSSLLIIPVVVFLSLSYRKNETGLRSQVPG
jgi:membrane protease YdiL (CAAX protease family)